MNTITDTTRTVGSTPAGVSYPVVRPERLDGSDIGAIHAVTAAAFAGVDHASGTEAAIVDALRASGDLTWSLVAVHAGRVVGHIAASPVTLDPDDGGRWYGIGPVSVHPDVQRQGTGSALMRALLDLLIVYGASGAVLLGDPSYYRRFGFVAREGLVLDGAAPEDAAAFQAVRLDGRREFPAATVRYNPAFGL